MTIPIVFSTNNAFTLPCYMAIHSLIEHADRRYSYDIRVLETELDDDNIRLICSLGRDGFEVSCVNVNEYRSKFELRCIGCLTIETYYRLFIPYILKEYDKAIYLDCDILVMDDISKVYKTDLQENILAAVDDVYCHDVYNHEKCTGIKEGIHSFNAGVLVMDLKGFRRDDILYKAMKLLEADYKRDEIIYTLADQDLLNVLLAEKTLRLEAKWNFLWRFLWTDDFLNDYYKEKYMQTSKNPSIIHYSGWEKPWDYPDKPLADIYWGEVIKTPIAYRFIRQEINSYREKYESGSRQIDDINKLNKLLKKYSFPFKRIPVGSKLVLYGAGMLGKAYYEFLNSSGYVDKLYWTDTNIVGNPNQQNLVTMAEIIKEMSEEEYFLIATMKDEYISQIRHCLKNYGITDDRIIQVIERNEGNM